MITVRNVHTISVVTEIGSTSKVSELYELVEPVPVDSFGVESLTLAALESDTAYGPRSAMMIESESDFVVKVGGSGNTPQTTKSFSHRGDSTTLYLSNPSATLPAVLRIVFFDPSA